MATGHYARTIAADDFHETTSSRLLGELYGARWPSRAPRREGEEEEEEAEQQQRRQQQQQQQQQQPPPPPPQELRLLQRAADDEKDQTYFLSSVPADVLGRVLFPIGHLTKPQVREVARKAGLSTADKAESMGVCFVGKKRRFADFLAGYMDHAEGWFEDLDGNRLEPHRGFSAYTIGQGAGISGRAERLFVVDKVARREEDDADDGINVNAVIVAPGSNHPALYRRQARVRASDFCWALGSPPDALAAPGTEDRSQDRGDRVGGDDDVAAAGDARGAADKTASSSTATSPRSPILRLLARKRHREPLVPCSVRFDAATGDLEATFDEPQRAVTLGQTLALYSGDACLGGGPVSDYGPTEYESKISSQRSEASHGQEPTAEDDGAELAVGES